MTARDNPLIRRLASYASLSPEDCGELAEATAQVRACEAREELIVEREKATAVNVILSGFACRYKVLEDGRRPILSLYIPGDFCDLHNFLLDGMSHGVATLSEAIVAVVPPSAVAKLTRRPALDRALQISELVQAAIYREWVNNVGHRSAVERTAHFFCETFWRLRAVGEVAGDRCPLPLIQAELGDLLGLSTVHVNRTLQELRGQGLVTVGKGELIVHQPDRLAALAGFDPHYLQLGDETSDASMEL